MDQEEVRRMVSTYSDLILRISYHYLQHTQDAEDVCQTVFLKMLTNPVTFQSKEHEKAWVIRTALNACKDLRKSAFFRKTVGLDAVKETGRCMEDTSELLVEIQKLPKDYRISIYLHYYEGYPVKEIAGIMGKREATVAKYLSRGRQKLRDALENGVVDWYKAGKTNEA